MSTERLDRIEQLLERTAQQTAENTAAIAELRSSVSSLVQIVEIHQQNFETIVTEIRGLRTETQRLMEHLFGQQGNGI